MVTQDAPDDVPDGVRVLGRLSDGDLTRAYQQAWVFCLPSTYEGFGIPYAEAMLSGLPVVATPNVGARYVTDNGRAGIVTGLDRLGLDLRALLTDESRLGALSHVSLRRGSEFRLSAVADSYLVAYRSERSAD